MEAIPIHKILAFVLKNRGEGLKRIKTASLHVWLLSHAYTKNPEKDQTGADESDQAILFLQEDIAKDNPKDNADLPHGDNIADLFKSHDENDQRIGKHDQDARCCGRPPVQTPFLSDQPSFFGKSDVRGEKDKTNKADQPYIHNGVEKSCSHSVYHVVYAQGQGGQSGKHYSPVP